MNAGSRVLSKPASLGTRSEEGEINIVTHIPQFYFLVTIYIMSSQKQQQFQLCDRERTRKILSGCLRALYLNVYKNICLNRLSIFWHLLRCQNLNWMTFLQLKGAMFVLVLEFIMLILKQSGSNRGHINGFIKHSADLLIGSRRFN